jgi:hypothetical protein
LQKTDRKEKEKTKPEKNKDRSKTEKREGRVGYYDFIEKTVEKNLISKDLGIISRKALLAFSHMLLFSII